MPLHILCVAERLPCREPRLVLDPLGEELRLMDKRLEFVLVDEVVPSLIVRQTSRTDSDFLSLGEQQRIPIKDVSQHGAQHSANHAINRKSTRLNYSP